MLETFFALSTASQVGAWFALVLVFLETLTSFGPTIRIRRSSPVKADKSSVVCPPALGALKISTFLSLSDGLGNGAAGLAPVICSRFTSSSCDALYETLALR